MTSCLKVNETVMAYADDCSTLPVATDLGSNWECDKEPLTETQCRTIDQGGICSTPPQNASLTQKDAGDAITSGGQAKTEAPPIIPNFNVDIPGFVAPEDGGLLLGTYISAIYRYAISISAVIATVMFIWGGFVYLIGSSGAGSIATGKSIMKDAVIGLLLLFSANLILRTLNPSLVRLDNLDVEMISGRAMTAVYEGSPPIFSGSVDPPPYGIPLECSTRATYRGQSLSQDSIQKYLEVQNQTGVPAAALIGQMFVESQNAAPCAMINMFDDFKNKCSTLANFAGINCTWKETGGLCPHVAFGPAKIGNSSGPALSPEESKKYVDKWNIKSMGHGGECAKQAFGFSKQSYIASDRCGDQCTAIASHTTLTDEQGRELWIETAYCLKNLDTPEKFIGSYMGFVKHCVPFNKSVYKFVYCVGLTTSYASGHGYAKAIANAIEKNCLCDPEKDADGCRRNIELEEDMASGRIKKFNFTKLASAGNWDEAALQRVVEKAWEMTDGRLTP